jgi:hypothetical protein
METRSGFLTTATIVYGGLFGGGAVLLFVSKGVRDPWFLICVAAVGLPFGLICALLMWSMVFGPRAERRKSGDLESRPRIEPS